MSAVTVTLPERLDTAGAAGLKKLIEDALAQAAPEAVSLDASGVTYVGGFACSFFLQVDVLWRLRPSRSGKHTPFWGWRVFARTASLLQGAIDYDG
ncbi:STAS domain-containing protein [Acetobacter papayae]|uniref:STAS domain-containing protein n=1 Tax=Acetobacter papayae TaxID=1076592 RepID=UPI0019010A75|nr:anti-sigma factor antagonist [Acetobacter papayae]